MKAKWFALVVFLLITGGLGYAILRQCQGHFSYTLDDPYIYLALVQRLALGHYGININEISTPASSIIWPFMLLPGVRLNWFQYLPLFLNILFGGGAAFLLGHIVDRLPWSPEERHLAVKKGIVVFLFIFIGNLCGLVYIGMEHSLQILVSIIAAYALIEAWEGRRVPVWCIVSVALGPTVRYEMFAIVAALAVTLAGQKRWMAAACLLAGSAIPPACFSLFLITHGLPPLPNSVLAKTGAYNTAQHNIFINIFLNSVNALKAVKVSSFRKLELVLIATAIYLAWNTRGPRRWPLLGTLLALILHFFIGQFGWFHRYEVFAFLFATLILYRAGAVLNGNRFLAGIGCLAVIAAPYLWDARLIPVASRNIYDQQYQMHRFVDDYYKKTFAVNDLGWVSYDLPPSIYVLDLWGLASNESLRQPHRDAAWLDGITREHNIGLVMIYREFFESIPDDWTKTGVLDVTGRLVTPAHNQVFFYVTNSGDKPGILKELQEFAKTLPPEDTLQLQN
jgi:hypothetical protein